MKKKYKNLLWIILIIGIILSILYFLQLIIFTWYLIPIIFLIIYLIYYIINKKNGSFKFLKKDVDPLNVFVL
jgi:phosphatidylserine synthase